MDDRNFIGLNQIRQPALGRYVSGIASGISKLDALTVSGALHNEVVALSGNLTALIANTNSVISSTHNIASGVDFQYLPYGVTYSATPKVTSALHVQGGPLLLHGISGKSTTGCFVVLSNKTTSNGYSIDLFSIP